MCVLTLNVVWQAMEVLDTGFGMPWRCLLHGGALFLVDTHTQHAARPHAVLTDHGGAW